MKSNQAPPTEAIPKQRQGGIENFIPEEGIPKMWRENGNSASI